ncbi:iron-siderophore ABC transporter substrate-binding protein [Kineococcus radiotolerans]|uniref:Periplasmic binding protein n=1 Tax=Kineococcus radiotolerans (strain ATCC BAA-149 / DSM 14245 / SRS30216) TaxID=266940 RepID=A6WBF3_KINRD|nr:iron-siderophore ABC transporter substrate-binding protein [Kineococcus radiotolerans]ABS04142.1 periplasmic binding protein [Kineococcus radiotolerans SRS30216 = ATCC BAA-149]
MATPQELTPTMTRFPSASRRAMLLSALGAALTTTACGASDEDAPASDPGTPNPDTGAETGAFPVTITTKFGTVTVEEAPRRVVALGWGDAETALALGVQPVGASDWLAFGGDGVGPWAAGRYTTPPQIIGTLEPSYEAIAALRPDLILDVKSSGDQDRHDTLAAIAPTVGVPVDGDSYLTSRRQQVTMIAQALGRPEEGRRLDAAVDEAFAAAAAAHPHWRGRTASAAARTSRGWGAYVEASERVQFLQRLGFVQNPQIAALPVSGSGFTVDLSPERLAVLDADVVVTFPISVPVDDITDDPVWQALPAVTDARAVILDAEVSSAYSLSSVLSLQYALDALVPLLEKALPR